MVALLGLGTVWAGGVATSCKGTSDPAQGLVEAPMAAENLALTDEDAGDGGDAALTARLMTEPRPPSNASCTRDVRCVDPLPAAPAWPYPQPFERCDPDPVGDAGRFSAKETTDRRQDEPDTCCYVSYRDCARRGYNTHVIRGRPLRDASRTPIVAATLESDAWSAFCRRAREPNERDGEDWLRAAALEHASVAEFARLSLALLALGAPADLVQGAHAAALDEIEHARICYAHASSLLGRAVGPGPLAIEPRVDCDVRALARDTVLDGCLGECVSALALREQAARDASARGDLLRMAADEERHAELAWKVLEFLLALDPRATADAALGALAEAETRPADDLEATVLRRIVRPCAEEMIYST